MLGVVVGWLLRVSGRTTCYAGPWDLSFEIEGGDEYGGQPTKRYDELEEGDRVGRARFVLPLDLFNPKEVPVGLRDVRIEVVREDGTRLPVRLHDADATRVVASRTISDDVDVVNLPPRQFLRVRLGGFLDAEEAKSLASGRCRRVEFFGEPPERRLLPTGTFRRTIAKP